MIDEFLTSNIHRVADSSVASIRQPFRNLHIAFLWHTGAMVDRSLISNTHRVSDPGVAPARVMGHQTTTVTQCATQTLEIETSARALALLESIDCRLRDVLRRQAASHVEPVESDHAYTRTQAARLLGVSTWTIDKGRKAGLLVEARRVGQRDVRITGESLAKYMKERKSASIRVRKL